MKNKATDARRHAFSRTDALLPDANIWMYLCGPVPPKPSWATTTYSAVFTQILRAGARMFTDAFVMSEFINRYARIRFEAAKMPGQNFKDYRKTAAFVPVAQEITAQARRILTNARPIDQSFSQIDLKLVLSEFETGAFDFNDQLLTETCRQNRLAILTNDADFTEGGFPPPIRHRGIRYMRRSSFL